MSPYAGFVVALAFYITYLVDKEHEEGLRTTAIVIGIVSLVALFVLALVFNETLYVALALVASGILISLISFVGINGAKPVPAKAKKK